MAYTKSKTDLAHDPSSGAVVFDKSRQWCVQKKPWIHPLPFHISISKYLEHNSFYYDSPDHHVVERPYGPIYLWLPEMWRGDSDAVAATNKARESFVNQMQDSAQNANNILEINQNVGSVVSKVKALSKAVSAVKKGDISGAAKALGATVSQKGAQKILKRSKQASDAWLELHFGWEPLVQDIGSSIDNIQGTGKAPTKNQKVFVRGRGAFDGRYFAKDPSDPWWATNSVDTRWLSSVRCAAIVSVNNPNLALANQMGFVNPLSVAWEAVPFSFVVDWFSNVGQCLSACTDFVGYDISNAYTTTFRKATTTKLNYTTDNIRWDLYSYSKVTTEQIDILRTTVIPGPTLHSKPFKGFSMARGATAVSLLVQQLANINKIR